MISSSTHSVFNKKIIDYVEEDGESVDQKDIAIVEAELIEELEELYEDYDYDVDEMEEKLYEDKDNEEGKDLI